MGQNQKCLSAEHGGHSQGQRIGHLPAEFEKKPAQPKSAVEAAGERLDSRATRKTLWTENRCTGHEHSSTIRSRTNQPMKSNYVRRFDWPACFQVFSNRPDKSPLSETYTVTHSTGNLKSRSISPSSVQATPDLLHSASNFRLSVQCEKNPKGLTINRKHISTGKRR
jgi:hypothetical protein